MPRGRKRSTAQSFTSKRFWLNESFTSLVLGILVVVVAGMLLISFFRGRGALNTTKKSAPEISAQKTQKIEEAKEEKLSDLPKEYSVAQGDSLWTIAEKHYKSGFNWVDIAQANKLENPDLVLVGTKLTLPVVEPRVMAGPDAITGSSYTVIKDDTLWDISVRAYGDGFRWVEVARMNNLANPDIIHAGNVLKLPR